MEIRSRAERALQNMHAAALMRCGLTCDYTSECLGFLRTNFDIEDPDVSCVPGVLAEFAKRQRFLFVDGYILSDSSQVPSSAVGVGSKAPRLPGPRVLSTGRRDRQPSWCTRRSRHQSRNLPASLSSLRLCSRDFCCL